MGEPAQPTTKGKFYLKTSEEYPFAFGFEYRFEQQNVWKFRNHNFFI